MEKHAAARKYVYFAGFEGYNVSAIMMISETRTFKTDAIFSMVSTLGTHLPDSIK